MNLILPLGAGSGQSLEYKHRSCDKFESLRVNVRPEAVHVRLTHAILERR
jgi:hypothetical protein